MGEPAAGGQIAPHPESRRFSTPAPRPRPVRGPAWTLPDPSPGAAAQGSRPLRRPSPAPDNRARACDLAQNPRRARYHPGIGCLRDRRRPSPVNRFRRPGRRRTAVVHRPRRDRRSVPPGRRDRARAPGGSRPGRPVPRTPGAVDGWGRLLISRTLVALAKPCAAILLAMVLVATALAALGVSPGAVFGALLNGAFGSWLALSDSIVKAMPLIFTGLAVSVAFTGALWNIGAEGQLLMGAMAACAIGIKLA